MERDKKRLKEQQQQQQQQNSTANYCSRHILVTLTATTNNPHIDRWHKLPGVGIPFFGIMATEKHSFFWNWMKVSIAPVCDLSVFNLINHEKSIMPHYNNNNNTSER